MKKDFFKVQLIQNGNSVSIDVPCLEEDFYKIVYDCLTSDCQLLVVDIHEKEV